MSNGPREQEPLTRRVIERRKIVLKDTVIDLVVRNFFKISFALAMLLLFLYIMVPFMISIVLGGILAMALSPFVEFFIRRGFSRATSLLLFSFFLGAVGLVPVVAFFVRGSRVVSELLHESNFSQLSLSSPPRATGSSISSARSMASTTSS